MYHRVGQIKLNHAVFWPAKVVHTQSNGGVPLDAANGQLEVHSYLVDRVVVSRNDREVAREACIPAVLVACHKLAGVALLQDESVFGPAGPLRWLIKRYDYRRHAGIFRCTRCRIRSLDEPPFVGTEVLMVGRKGGGGE
jgi:hypothetical protein